ncbi:Phosphoglucosamine mutase [hydrothermal vent metagenome]|uniref:Phosphoglucosamine mutase n=1 Tax=hydrothermal vent metagenome TaxID=652676 RepID=A0A3B0W0R2_9ZZZZ
MQKKYFGTDGIRNRVGRGMISPDQVLKLGWATGKIMKERGESSVMIGKDTRISGYMFESALEAGFIAAGIDVLLLGPMPTPAVAYLTQTFHADAGVVISASHNPHYDNGIKFFSASGKKVSDEIELAIECMFEQKIEVVSSEQLGKAKRIGDAAGRYIEFCKSTYTAKKKLEGLKIVLDCAHGATYHIAPNVFTELGAEVVVIGAEPDGVNINEGCGATNLEALRKKVLHCSADLGIAFDGDGDRVMIVDEGGQVLDGDAILYVLATAERHSLSSVSGTVMSNLGLENALKQKGITLHRTLVGDRYVMASLLENDLCYGAEPSGHVLCLDKTTTGDGIIAALQVLTVMMDSGQGLAQLRQGLDMYPQVLKNVPVECSEGVDENALLQSKVMFFENLMGDSGRILIRASGTEPLIRVMVEGKELNVVEKVAIELVNLVKSEFS